jgi:hypothetical protein
MVLQIWLFQRRSSRLLRAFRNAPAAAAARHVRDGAQRRSAAGELIGAGRSGTVRLLRSRTSDAHFGPDRATTRLHSGLGRRSEAGVRQQTLEPGATRHPPDSVVARSTSSTGGRGDGRRTSGSSPDVRGRFGAGQLQPLREVGRQLLLTDSFERRSSPRANALPCALEAVQETRI